jgi:hypothetical protein
VFAASRPCSVWSMLSKRICCRTHSSTQATWSRP